MFNTTNGYSLADVAAAARGRDDEMFGGNSWWIIILFLLFFGGGWGNGFNGAGNGTEAIISTMDANSIKDGIAGIQNTLCSGFSGINANVATASKDLAAEIASANYSNLQNTYVISNQLNNIASAHQLATCQTNDLINATTAELGTRLSDVARSIIDNNTSNTKSILDFLTQSKIDDLAAENAALRTQISQSEQNAYLVNQLGTKAPIAAYTVANPYASYNACNSCNSCNGYSY